MDEPFISIITPSYNRAGMISAAIESVQAQGYSHCEHIIVDGASTDDTLAVLGRYPHLQVVSEPDRGMYDAINKGLKLARGTVVAWLNTDDVYPPNAFSTVARAFQSHPQALAISGAAETFEVVDGVERQLGIDPPVSQNDFWRRIITSPVPNGWFFKTALFEKVGFFNPDFRIVADRELIIRIALARISPVPVEQVLYRYRQHEGSATFYSEGSAHPVYGPRRMTANREDLRMLAGFFVYPDLPPDMRRELVRANDEYAYRLISTALYHHRWEYVSEGLRAGFRRNPLFGMACVYFALRRLFWRTG